MKRSAVLIPATFGLLAFTGCSTIRQIDRYVPQDSPAPTTSYVVDIGTPAFPITGQPDPCLAGTGTCETTTTTVTVPTNDPPCGLDGFPSPCQTPITVPSEPAEGVCTDGLVHAEDGGCN